MTTSNAARESILAAVRAARPALIPRPSVRDVTCTFASDAGTLVERFVEASRNAGASIMFGDRRDALVIDPDAFVCEATLGVAENGAVWLPDSALVDRAALFLAEHVVVVLDRMAIVDTLHAAYDRINIENHAFGVFMAGPSKTADIEQSLVIGAHGPKRLTLLLA